MTIMANNHSNVQNNKRSNFTKISGFSFLVVLFLVMVLFSYSPHQASAEEKEAGIDGPFTITVKMGIIDIPVINEPMETFDIDSYLFLKWNDPSAYEKYSMTQVLPEDKYTLYSSSNVQSALREIGWPEVIQFTNQVGKREVLSSYLYIESNGNITYYERFQGTFHSKYELKKYPFDTQELNILIESAYYDTTIMKFDNPFPEGSSKILLYESPIEQLSEGEVFELEEWYLDSSIDIEVGEYVASVSERSFSYMSIDIPADRKSGFHIWKIFLPLILIIGISWSVFWIWSENVGSRLSVSVIGFLTAISFNFFVSSNLPKISYLTFMDYCIIGIFIFMTITVAQVLITHFLVRRGGEVLAVRLNSYSRWLFPIAFLLYLLIAGIIVLSPG